MGERDAGSVEARGSSPLTSTYEFSDKIRGEDFGSYSRHCGTRLLLSARTGEGAA